MTINAIDLASTHFTTNLEMLLQQKGTKLRPYVSEGSYVGKAANVVDQIGAIEAINASGRFGPKGRVDASVTKRWVYPEDKLIPQLLDNRDKLRLIVDPKSQWAQNANAGMGRAIDDVILSAMFGTSKTGVAGGTSTIFGTTLSTSGGQNIAVGTGAAAATGLNVAKLREVRRQALANEIDLDSDPLYMAITSKQDANLLQEIQITSMDFNDRPVLKDGKVMSFLGIQFIHIERLTTGSSDSGTARQCPVWCKSGLHLGMWNDIKTTIAQRYDLEGNPWGLDVEMTIGATRTQEKKVFRVWCAE